jgi:hypothetical protein
MKNYLLFTLLAFSVFKVNAQNELIKERFLTMQQLLLDKKFTASLDYTAEELFTVVPKEQLVATMEATFNNPKMQIVSELPKVLSISEVFRAKDKFYAILDIVGDQKIRILDEKDEALGLDDRLLYALKLKFEQQYGVKNVAFNEKTKFFKVKVAQNIIAISLDGETEWKYVAIDNLQLEVISKLLPAEVLTKILEND